MALPNRRRSVAAALAVVATFLAVVSLVPPPTHVAGAGPLLTAEARAATGCPGSPLAKIVNGTLDVEGSVLTRPPTANQTVALSYQYETNQSTPSGASLHCLHGTATAVTNASGGFVLNLTLPGMTCNSGGCLSYRGPFGPETYRVLSSGAPGYYLSTHVHGGSAALDWVSALQTGGTSPGGFATLSVNAATTIRALAFDGAGTASTANLTYAWQLSGTGWTSTGSSTTAAFVVDGNLSGTDATVTLWVNGSYNGTSLSAPVVHLYLLAAATRATGGSFVPTALDVGIPAEVSLLGSGADGYTYTATVNPGDGKPAQTSACTASAQPGGVASLACSVTVVYDVAGVAQPTATLSNGYSTANWTFPTVAVANPLGIVVDPDPAAAYAGSPVHLHVAVEGSTGTSPFGPACLLTGDGRFVCDTTAGPSWTLTVPYANVGTYHGTVTVADGAGANRTAPLEVDIAAPPLIPQVALSLGTVTRGLSETASAVVTGGAFPLSYWWNSSDPSSTLASGEVGSDAVPSVTFVAGFDASNETVTLTVVDALGTVVAHRATFALTSPIHGIQVLAPAANGTIPAGTPLALSVVGVDDLGATVAGFSSRIEIQPDPDCGAVWVNDTSGPVPSVNGTFTILAGNWSRTGLPLTISASAFGACNLQFAAPGAAPSIPFRFAVGPDLTHLRLVRPTVVHPTASENDTRYAVVDRFGNPDPSGYMVVETRFGSLLQQSDEAIHEVAGSALVWVNYTAEATVGSLTVITEHNLTILGPLSIPAAPAPGGVPAYAWAGLGAVVVAGAVGAAMLLRRRRDRPELESPLADDALHRLAEGRTHVLSRLTTDRDSDLDEIAAGFPGRPPDPSELAEWVGTLVTEGLVRATVGPDGRPVFRRGAPDEPAPAPKVEVDPMALDAALARRDLDASEGPPPDPPA